MAGLKGRNYYFEHTNRNKRSIVLDLKNKEGMEVFLKLIDTADVFLNNMSIEAPIKLGIGRKTSGPESKAHLCSGFGWGERGLMRMTFPLTIPG